MSIAVLLTRPARSGEAFAALLEDRFPGRFDVCHAPLTEIVPEYPGVNLDGAQALLFSSRNAVRVFAENWSERGIPAICVGPGTTAEAQSFGFAAASADGDAAALAQIAAQSWLPGGGHYVYLRGRDAAGDVVGSLAAQGIPAEEAILYNQRTLPLSEAAIARLTAPTPVLAPVFSPASAERLAWALADLGDDLKAEVTVLAISNNAARALENAAIAALYVSAAPNAPSVADLIGGFVAA